MFMARLFAFMPGEAIDFCQRLTATGAVAGRNVATLALFLACTTVLSPGAWGQAHEFGLSLGRLNSGDRGSATGPLEIGAGTALQANYARRLETSEAADLYLDLHVLGSPHRDVTSSIPTASRDFATLYVTPGFKVKFRPASRLTPYVLGGIGLAFFEQSRLDNAGEPNTAPRMLRRGVFTYGGGADLRTAPWLAFRGEYRGFLSGAPALDASQSSGAYHAWVVSGGIVFRIGR
jgi:opacity protein-like surface antigen